jgi:hypothetical protein
MHVRLHKREVNEDEDDDGEDDVNDGDARGNDDMNPCCYGMYGLGSKQ